MDWVNKAHLHRHRRTDGPYKITSIKGVHTGIGHTSHLVYLNLYSWVQNSVHSQVQYILCSILLFLCSRYLNLRQINWFKCEENVNCIWIFYFQISYCCNALFVFHSMVSHLSTNTQCLQISSSIWCHFLTSHTSKFIWNDEMDNMRRGIYERHQFCTFYWWTNCNPCYETHT